MPTSANEKPNFIHPTIKSARFKGKMIWAVNDCGAILRVSSLTAGKLRADRPIPNDGKKYVDITTGIVLSILAGNDKIVLQTADYIYYILHDNYIEMEKIEQAVA